MSFLSSGRGGLGLDLPVGLCGNGTDVLEVFSGGYLRYRTNSVMEAARVLEAAGPG